MKQEMKVGPKGQIVIPKLFREDINIYPGDKVILELKDKNIIIGTPVEEPIKVFRTIAKKGKSTKIDSDKDYEDMMEERWKKIST